MRAAHRDKRCHSEVGAPAKQDYRAAVVRHMSRRPRTETSPWYVDPWSPLCPSIADHHGVDERSMRGVCPSSRAGTKLEFATPDLWSAIPCKFKGRFPLLSGGFCVTYARRPVCACVDP